MERGDTVEAVATEEVETQDPDHETGAPGTILSCIIVHMWYEDTQDAEDVGYEGNEVHVPLPPGSLDGDVEEGGHHLEHGVHQPGHQQPVAALHGQHSMELGTTIY